MTETTRAASGSGSRRAVGFGVIIAVALLVVALFAGRSGSEGGPPLSPSSTDPDGTRALVLLLQENGVQVDLRAPVPPPANDRVAFVLRDNFGDDERRALEGWVDAGGTLVIADPASPLAPFVEDAIDANVIARNDCDVTGLNGVERVAVRNDDVQFESVRYTALERYTSCFGDTTDGYVVRIPAGRGAVVAIGGQGPFTNGLLDEQDNAVLAFRLLAPEEGTTVAVYDPARVGQGTTTLVDLMPERVVEAVIQAAIALLVYVLWRLRRLGAPVVEPQVVDIPGSELVRAVGSLQERANGYHRAGSVLQTDTRRRLALRYGLPADAPPDVVAAAVSAHSTLDRARVNAAIGHTASPDDEGLLALTNELDEIREEVLDGSS